MQNNQMETQKDHEEKQNDYQEMHNSQKVTEYE